MAVRGRLRHRCFREPQPEKPVASRVIGSRPLYRFAVTAEELKDPNAVGGKGFDTVCFAGPLGGAGKAGWSARFTTDGRTIKILIQGQRLFIPSFLSLLRRWEYDGLRQDQRRCRRLYSISVEGFQHRLGWSDRESGIPRELYKAGGQKLIAGKHAGICRMREGYSIIPVQRAP